jgi:hypothetical protein
MSNRYARVCMEEAIKYGRTRKTFGKRLMDHQVLRHKVAEMARAVESTHALLEQIAYQMKAGTPDQHMAGMIAMTKVAATKVRRKHGKRTAHVPHSDDDESSRAAILRISVCRRTTCVLGRRRRSWVVPRACAVVPARLSSVSTARFASTRSAVGVRRS